MYTLVVAIPLMYVFFCTCSSVDILSNTSQLTLTATICSLVFFTLGVLVGVICHQCATVNRCIVPKTKCLSSSRSSPPGASVSPVYEQVSLENCSGKKSDIELKENVAYGPV